MRTILIHLQMNKNQVKDVANKYLLKLAERHCKAFTFMHLADAFIQSDLQCIQAIHVLSLCVFPGNRTHNLLRC